MPRRAGKAPGHLRGRNDAHVSFAVDHIRTDKQLVRFAVDEPVRRRAADGARKNLLGKIGADTV